MTPAAESLKYLLPVSQVVYQINTLVSIAEKTLGIENVPLAQTYCPGGCVNTLRRTKCTRMVSAGLLVLKQAVTDLNRKFCGGVF